MQRDLFLGGQRCWRRNPDLFSLPFIRNKPERLVTKYRAARRSAKLVILKNIRGLRRTSDRIISAIEVIPRIKMVVPKILEDASVNVVRTRLGHDVHN